MARDYKKPRDIFSILSNVCETLSVSNKRQHLIDAVLDTILQVFRSDCTWIQLVELKNKRLSLAAHRGLTSDMVSELSQADAASSPSNQVTSQGHRIIISDLSHDGKYHLSSFSEAGLRSLVIVPLRTYRMQGIIGIASSTKKRFDTETAELLEVIADFVGVTLDKIELRERTSIRENQLKEGVRLNTISNPGKDETDCNSPSDLKEAGEVDTITRGEAEKVAAETPGQILSPEFNPIEPKNDCVTFPREVHRRDKISVFIVDEKVLSRQGLRLYLSQTEDIEVIGECDYFLDDTVLMIEELTPSEVLVDINLPSLSGLDLARQIIQRLPDVSVILLTLYEDDNQIFDALNMGVAGYLSKSITPEELANAIRRVHGGNRIINNLLIRPGVAQRVLNRFQDIVKVTKHLTASLSLQEKELLGYFVRGYSTEKVAHAMAVRDEDVAKYMSNIVSKLIANRQF